MFKLVDHEVGNLLGAFDTEDEALDAIRDDIEAYGRKVAKNWALYDDGRLVSRGLQLADRVTGSAGVRRSA
jgi:hypothetical protein